MMSLTFGLFTQVSGSGPLGPLVETISLMFFSVKTYAVTPHQKRSGKAVLTRCQPERF